MSPFASPEVRCEECSGVGINHSAAPDTGCCRVASGYPEVCLVSLSVAAGISVAWQAFDCGPCQKAQSRLREAHLEEARP